jgi:hypothetical protein
MQFNVLSHNITQKNGTEDGPSHYQALVVLATL